LLQSIDEMELLLDSLQRFLRAQHLRSHPELVDLNALLRDLAEPLGHCASLACPATALVETYREPLLLSVQALMENACRYGQRADVTVEKVGSEWIIEIEDDGP